MGFVRKPKPKGLGMNEAMKKQPGMIATESGGDTPMGTPRTPRRKRRLVGAEAKGSETGPGLGGGGRGGFGVGMKF